MAKKVKIQRPTKEHNIWNQALGQGRDQAYTLQLKRLWESYKKQQVGTSAESFSHRPNSRVTYNFNPTNTTKKNLLASPSASLHFHRSFPPAH